MDQSEPKPKANLFSLANRRTPSVSSTPQKPEVRLPYPEDSGIFSLKVGDVVMTRALYEFLLVTIKLMPTLTQDELKSVCNQISTDMEKLVK